MTINRKKIIKIAVIVIVIVMVVFFSCWLWLSNGNLTPAKEKVFNILPFPAVVIEGRAVSMKTYIERYKLASAFQEDMPAPALQKMVFDRLVEENKMKALARKKNATATKAQVTEEFNRRVAQDKNLNAVLKSYSITEDAYKNDAVATEVAAANLTAWFYGQRSLNPTAYARADAIIEKINQSGFARAAESYGQDSEARSLGGDLGFLTLDQILPEVQNALKEAGSAGSITVIPTRFGIEIIQLEETDNKGPNGEQRLHLRHIFINGENFENWYETQTKNYKIIKIWK